MSDQTKADDKKPYAHPTTLLEFESIYREEYIMELQSSDRWIAWCKEHSDTHGVTFHQGLRGACIFNNLKMEQLLCVLKQKYPNANAQIAQLTKENDDLEQQINALNKWAKKHETPGEHSVWETLDNVSATLTQLTKERESLAPIREALWRIASKCSCSEPEFTCMPPRRQTEPCNGRSIAREAIVLIDKLVSPQ